MSDEQVVVSPQAAAPSNFVATVQATQTTDSPQPAAVAPTPEATPAQTVDSQAAPQTPATELQPGQDSVQQQLAVAEQRIRDTQAWGHKNAQENAKLKNELNALFNHPVFQQVAEAQSGQTATTPQQVVQDEGLKKAWAEYQASPNDEAAFAKLISLAEERGSRRAVSEVEAMLQQRETATAVRQRNVAAADTINQTVASTAPDVPLELFWAMSGRAEQETPPELQSVGERLQWQVGRAIDLSRATLANHTQRVRTAVTQQQAVTRQAGAIMPAGGTSPVQGGTPSSTQFPSMVDSIKQRQRLLSGR